MTALESSPRLTLRSHQEDAVAWLCRTKCGIVQVPAGGGKTVIAAEAIFRVAMKRDGMPRIVWMANTIEQCAQASDALLATGALGLSEFTIGCPADPDVQAMAAQCDLLVVDECHHAAAPSWAEIILRARGARWGLSATPFGSDEVRNDLLRALFTKNLFTVDRRELVEAGHLSRARAIFMPVEDEGGVVQREIEDKARIEWQKRTKKWPWLNAEEQLGRCRWQFCAEIGLNGHAWRNALLLAAAAEHPNDSLLILVQTVEHGKILSSSLPGSIVAHSGMGRKARASAIIGFRDGSVRTLIATSLADEGLDVPRAGVLILASAGRSATKIEQRTGRVLRFFAGKSEGVIYDFEDHTHFMLLAQSRARRKLYLKLGYEVLP